PVRRPARRRARGRGRRGARRARRSDAPGCRALAARRAPAGPRASRARRCRPRRRRALPAPRAGGRGLRRRRLRRRARIRRGGRRAPARGGTHVIEKPDCIFCAIVAGRAPAAKIAESEHALAFLDLFPVTEGHALVIPKTHYENLFEADATTLPDVHLLARRVALAMRRALAPDGLMMFQLNG